MTQTSEYLYRNKYMLKGWNNTKTKIVKLVNYKMNPKLIHDLE